MPKLELPIGNFCRIIPDQDPDRDRYWQPKEDDGLCYSPRRRFHLSDLIGKIAIVKGMSDISGRTVFIEELGVTLRMSNKFFYDFSPLEMLAEAAE